MVASSSSSKAGGRRRRRPLDGGRKRQARMAHTDEGRSTRTSTLWGASDVVIALGLVFGGCCANVWSFEELLRGSHGVGSAITFCQMLFVACQSAPKIFSVRFLAPEKWVSFEIKSRRVPLRIWLVQVLVLLGGTLLNNWSFAYNVPLTLQIVVRSSGLPVSLLLGRVFLKKRYSSMQVGSVGLVTLGVMFATVSRAAESHPTADADDYLIGLLMLLVSLLFTGVLGVLQEITFTEFGPCWQESVFYTHALSLPAFIFLLNDVLRGFDSILRPRQQEHISWKQLFILAINVYTQFVCVTGVNQLSARVTSVTKNVALTARKAMSLCLSVWLFKSDWNLGLLLGATMVFSGSIMYAVVTGST